MIRTKILWLLVVGVWIMCAPTDSRCQDRDQPVEDAPGRAQNEPDSRDLAKNFQSLYQDFVEKFRAEKNLEARVALIKARSQELNQLLSKHCRTATIAPILPQLVKVQLLDLEPTFVEVIDEHPDRPTRALALLCFAKYLGNNQEDEMCFRTLAYLKKNHGTVKYQNTTFGKAADEAFYFIRNLAIGRPAPATVGEDVDGQLFKLSDYKGKVVMLRFWGNWCPACRQMFPFEQDLVSKYRNQPFALVGVNSDSLEECKRAQRHSNLTWRTIWDGGNTRGPVSMIYRIEQWPTIIVIDAKGVIRYRAQGLAEAQLLPVLERCIAEAKSQPTAVREQQTELETTN